MQYAGMYRCGWHAVARVAAALSDPNEWRQAAGDVAFPVRAADQSGSDTSAERPHHLVMYCRSGRRSIQAAMLAHSLGFHVSNYPGSYLDWLAHHPPPPSSS
jgi:rhodanese-related sulfurtransferase